MKTPFDSIIEDLNRATEIWNRMTPEQRQSKDVRASMAAYAAAMPEPMREMFIEALEKQAQEKWFAA